MSKTCSAAHCPFVAPVSPGFFGCESWEDLDRKHRAQTITVATSFSVKVVKL